MWCLNLENDPYLLQLSRTSLHLLLSKGVSVRVIGASGHVVGQGRIALRPSTKTEVAR